MPQPVSAMVKWMPSGRTLCQCLAVIRWPTAYVESCRTILGLPDVPLLKYMSMGSNTFVSTRSNASPAARTSLLKSIQPSRSIGAPQMPCSPESSAPIGPSAMGLPSSSRGASPPPAPFTRKNFSTVGHS